MCRYVPVGITVSLKVLGTNLGTYKVGRKGESLPGNIEAILKKAFFLPDPRPIPTSEHPPLPLLLQVLSLALMTQIVHYNCKAPPIDRSVPFAAAARLEKGICYGLKQWFAPL